MSVRNGAGLRPRLLPGPLTGPGSCGSFGVDGPSTPLRISLPCGTYDRGVYDGPFVRLPRPLPEAMQAEVIALGARYGEPIVRAVALDDCAFDPVGNPDRFAEVCMVVRRPSGGLLLSTKTFYPDGAHRLPTGGIQAGEEILAAVRRETQEETGLDVELRRFLAAITYLDGPEGPPIFHTFAFLLGVLGGTLGPLDLHEQISEYIAVRPGELPAVADRLGSIRAGAAPGSNWPAWGRFRAVVHRIVAEALA